MDARALLWLCAFAGAPEEAATSSAPLHRALLLTRGVPPAEAPQVAEALARELGMELLDDHQVEERLRREAAALGPDPEDRARVVLARAKEEFLELRLPAARASFDQALSLLLAADRAPADPAAVAAVFFERALLSLAAKERRAAEEDLRVAISIAPGLRPDPDRYGPPALRALAQARRAMARAPAWTLEVESAPADAETRLNGAPFRGPITARGAGPHLLTVARPGYRARSELVRLLGPRTRRDVVLERASGPLLARQALAAWTVRGPELGRLSGELGLMVAQSLALTRLVETASAPAGQLELTLWDPAGGEVLRAVRGARVPWEPAPWRAAAAALAGRTLRPPAEPSLSLSAPRVVGPGEPISLELELRDPDRRVARLEARCGAARVARESPGSGALALVLSAPAEEGELGCAVSAHDARGAALVHAPPAPTVTPVRVLRPAAPWYARWYLWTAIGGAVIGGAALSWALTRPPEQVLVIHGPR